jgi:putative ABC transport system ATP-binding protein
MTSLSEPLIQLNDVDKIYKTAAGSFPALKKITLQVFPGEYFGIIGKSGAGKSTMLNMISGVDKLSAGSVLMRGKTGPINIHDMDENQQSLWRGVNMGVVFQSFQLLPMLTLLENIMLPMDLCGTYRNGKSKDRACELLHMVELDEHAHKLPAYISGGQQQRVAIARALANDPPILIADEPTGSLDSLTAEHIFEVFDNLVSAGKTIIMVTHDNSIAPRFTRHIQLQDGEIIDPDVIQDNIEENPKKRWWQR